MVTPIALQVSGRLDVHRIADPRPVELAQAPRAQAPAEPGAGATPSPSGPLVAGSTVAQLLQIKPEWSGGAQAFADARAAGAYGLASMAETPPLTPLAPRYAYEELSGLGFIPGEVFQSGDPARALREHLRGEVAAARNAARREQSLSDKAGVEVRLAYDPNTDGAVALYPGDEGYDEVEGARAMFERMGWDLQKMGENLQVYADLLRL